MSTMRECQTWSPDHRKWSKSEVWCCHCGKTLRPGQRRRYVHVIFGGATILHPGDEAQFAEGITYFGGGNGDDLGFHPVGLDCAKRIGLEWTRNVEVDGAS